MNFDEWFQSKQGTPYYSYYDFAKDAWNAAQAAERETSEEYNKAYLDECAEMAKEAVESEREACAKVCEVNAQRWPDARKVYVAHECAAAIRASGQK